MVVRVIAVANVAILIVVGALCLVAVARPAGIVAAAIAWALALALIAFLPYTDPRRRSNTTW